MRLFFDTSLLVATAIANHPHHNQAFAAFRQVTGGRHVGVVAAHALAETYSILTRFPVSPMIHPSEALRFINTTVIQHCEVISLRVNDYASLIESFANNGIRGGAIYDGIQVYSAEKANCDRIYTFNILDFLRLAPHLQNKIVRP